jgi:hypothetical protein
MKTNKSVSYAEDTEYLVQSVEERTTIEAEGNRKGKGRARHNLASFIPLLRFIPTSDEEHIVYDHPLLFYNQSQT